MQRPFRTVLGLALAAALLLPAVSLARVLACEYPPERLILLRHAAKQDDSDDSPLSKKGWAQAADLVEQLGDEDISDIYVTTKTRSRQTAIPLAEYKKLEPIVVPDTELGTEQMIGRVCRRQVTGTVVYVGHTYTLSQIFEAFELDAGDRYAAADAMEITFARSGRAEVGPVKQVRPARARD